MRTDAKPAAKDATPAVSSKPVDVVDEVVGHWSLLAQAVSLIEPRFTARVLRTLPSVRRRLDAGKLHKIIERAYPKASPQRDQLVSLLPDAPSEANADVEMATDTAPAPAEKPAAGKAKAPTPTAESLPEVDVYVTLLALVFLLDHKHHSQALALADQTVARIQTLNRRTLDGLSARVLFYFARAHELIGEPSALASIRPTLLACQRTAALRHDDESQATLLNLLLRNFLAHSLFDQADRLIAKSSFPESASNPQLARWAYYVGRIRAIQLNYTDAHQRLQQAVRRAPEPHVAPGFLQAVHKLSIVVELLMGEIPERSTFREPVLRKALVPYLHIVQAVRVGDIEGFNRALAQHAATTFKPDGTLTLITRLRHNVIKTALRTISLAYSRIPLSLVCTKLHLDSEEEAEYIVAKAIRDGVIDAGIDHEQGYMKSREVVDVYSTAEPQRAFNERITFCLQLHNESVKAMRYPLEGAHKKELASAAEATERERELAKGLENGDIDGDDEMGGPGDLL